MRFSMLVVVLFAVAGVGCGGGSDVPEELRASPQTAATPDTAIKDGPKGAAAPESPF